LTDAIRSRETVIVEDPEAYARRYPDMVDDTRAAGLASTASIPLIAGGVVCGAIGVGWAHVMEGEDSFVGRLHAVARLTAETLARTQTSDTHAALITALQERMVPAVATGPSLDISVRYQAAGAGLGFGGDWYDVIALDDARTTVVVGDVVGHGIEAAATMVVVRSALNAVVQLGTPLADILGVAGRVVEGPVNAYIGTAVVLVVDTEAHRIGYSSAGHPPVLVVYRDGETRFLEDSRGPVLGIRDRVPAAGSVPFPPDAIAIAYTDGLIETRRGTFDGGLARLRAAALEGLRAGHGAQVISEHIMASIVDLAHLEDDIALVVVRNTGSA
jgi:serine phosphatase RsbU (regulator of sigma subunit)